MTETTPGRRRQAAPRRWVSHWPAAILIGIYVVHFSWVSVAVHEGYGTGAFDVGIFDQGTWLLSRFKNPFVTLNGRNLFGDHASVVLLPLVPLYWLHDYPGTLLVVQSAALGLAGLPIYLLALHQLKSRAAATALLATFLAGPVLQQGNLDEFHPESFLVFFAAVALPMVAYNVVSAFGYQHRIEFHYSLVLAPILAAATIAGLAAITNRWRRAVALQLVVASAVLAAGQWSIFPIGPGIDYRRSSTSGVHEIEAVLRRLPPRAAVTVDYTYAAHLAHRETVYMWPNPFRAAYWGRFEHEGQCLADRARTVEYLALRSDVGSYSKEEAATFATLLPRLERVTGNREATIYRHLAVGKPSACHGLGTG